MEDRRGRPLRGPAGASCLRLVLGFDVSFVIFVAYKRPTQTKPRKQRAHTHTHIERERERECGAFAIGCRDLGYLTRCWRAPPFPSVRSLCIHKHGQGSRTRREPVVTGFPPPVAPRSPRAPVRQRPSGSPTPASSRSSRSPRAPLVPGQMHRYIPSTVGSVY